LGKNNLSLKRGKTKVYKYPTCQWRRSGEIKLVPVGSLVNLKLGEAPCYRKLWKKQGWPINRYLCWVCRQNCELAYRKLNVWLCPGCRKVWVYLLKLEARVSAYQQLPANCSCGWKKKRLSKREQKKIADQTIKSSLVYQKKQKGYLSQCSFCSGAIEGQHKNKLVKNRNQVRFWTDKVSEERLICNGCLRENGEFQKLLLGKYRGRWRDYKSKGMI